MRTDLLIAGGLSALVALAVASTRRAAPAPTPPVPPTPPPAQRLPAYATVRTIIRAQPTEEAEALGSIPAGARIDVETSATPGWVYGEAVRVGLAPLEGYVRIDDISYSPPVLTPAMRPPLGGVGQILGRFSVPIGRGASEIDTRPPPIFRRPDIITVPPPVAPTAPPAPPISSPPPPPPGPPEPSLWLGAPIGFLTGEAPRGAAVNALTHTTELARARLDAEFQRTGGPPLRRMSAFRSFADQASIVGNMLRSLRITPASDISAIRRALLENLTTRSIPGFSRHHWGTDVDVLTTDSSAWRRGGAAARFIEPIAALAPRFGLYHPYREGAFPEPTRPHYEAEPWHLSLAGPGEALRQRWLREIADVPAQYDGLVRRAAQAIASQAGGLDPERVRAALASIDLASFVRNVAPVSTGAIA